VTKLTDQAPTITAKPNYTTPLGAIDIVQFNPEARQLTLTGLSLNSPKF